MDRDTTHWANRTPHTTVHRARHVHTQAHTDGVLVRRLRWASLWLVSEWYDTTDDTDLHAAAGTFNALYTYQTFHQCSKLIVAAFWGQKIDLSGISPAKRSRSGPNSVHVDMSRGDNVQGILGAIGPFWAKWELGRVPQRASFLCGKNHARDLSATSQRPIFTKFGHETYFGVPSRNPEIIFENFHFRDHLPPKSEIDSRSKSNRHLTHSRLLQVTVCTAERYCLLHVVVQGPCREIPISVNFSVRRQSCPIFGFWPIYVPSGDQPIQPRGYIAEWLRFFHVVVKGPKGCVPRAAQFSCDFW